MKTLLIPGEGGHVSRNYSVSQNINSSGEDSDHQHHGHKKGLKIASLNVNGLCNHLDELQSLIYDNGIHILALNETNCHLNTPRSSQKLRATSKLDWTELPMAEG